MLRLLYTVIKCRKSGLESENLANRIKKLNLESKIIDL